MDWLLEPDCGVDNLAEHQATRIEIAIDQSLQSLCQ